MPNESVKAPPAAATFPVSAATLPGPDGVEESAERIVKGETLRKTAAGATLVAMAMPSVEDVRGLAAFTAAHNETKKALVKTDSEREAASTVYVEAQALTVEIYDTVEFRFRKDPSNSSRREKCRRWDVVYLNDAPPPPTSHPRFPPANRRPRPQRPTYDKQIKPAGMAYIGGHLSVLWPQFPVTSSGNPLLYRVPRGIIPVRRLANAP